MNKLKIFSALSLLTVLIIADILSSKAFEYYRKTIYPLVDTGNSLNILFTASILLLLLSLFGLFFTVRASERFQDTKDNIHLFRTFFWGICLVSSVNWILSLYDLLLTK